MIRRPILDVTLGAGPQFYGARFPANEKTRRSEDRRVFRQTRVVGSVVSIHGAELTSPARQKAGGQPNA